MYKRRKFKVIIRSKVRKKKFSQAIKYGIKIFIIVIICYNAIKFLPHLSKIIPLNEWFRIKTIEITGLKTIPETTFLRQLPFQINDIFLKSYFINIKKLQQQWPIIKNIAIKYHFTNNKITVEVTEATPLAKIYTTKSYIGIDERNVTFLLKQPIEILPEIVGSVSKELLHFLLLCKEKWFELYANIKKICTTETQEIVITLAAGTTIYWGKLDENVFQEKLSALRNVLFIQNRPEDISYVYMNLFNENKIIIKPATKQ